LQGSRFGPRAVAVAGTILRLSLWGTKANAPAFLSKLERIAWGIAVRIVVEIRVHRAVSPIVVGDPLSPTPQSLATIARGGVGRSLVEADVAPFRCPPARLEQPAAVTVTGSSLMTLEERCGLVLEPTLVAELNDHLD
jgi:hypothetical protein